MTTTLARLMRLAACVAILLASACAHAPHARDPQNLGLLKTRLVAYHDHAYATDLAAVAREAERYVLARAPTARKPALVLDIDETALSNWDVIVADDFGYFSAGGCEFLPKGPCGWIEWDKLAKAPAIEPTLHLFDTARGAGIRVFFVTGRRETERAWTERALVHAGYAGWEALVMKPVALDASAAAYKSDARANIEAEGFTIVANVGDQQSDLEGGHAERTFKMPNPFYYVP